MSSIRKAHSHAWLDSKVYRLVWLAGPLMAALFVFGSIYWISPQNNLRILPLPLRYTDKENEDMLAALQRKDPGTLQVLRRASDDEDPRALHYLGLLYDPTGNFGTGVTPSLDAALAYFDRAAALGSFYAAADAGSMFVRAGEYARACGYFERAFAARNDLPMIASEMGYCLIKGKDSTAADKVKGLAMMEEAAASGYVYANLMLAYIYLNQTSPDGQRAIALFEKAAAELDDVDQKGDAYYQLGAIYFYGKAGVAQDFGKAIANYQKAHENGSSLAALDLSFIYSSGRYGVTIDRNKSFEYAKFSADRGNFNAHHNQFLNYLEGVGVLRNYDMAAVHFLNAISLGNKRTLEMFVRDHTTFPRDFVVAVQGKLARAVLYAGPVDGRFNVSMQRSLEDLFDRKRTFGAK